jgi:hypothetical protein
MEKCFFDISQDDFSIVLGVTENEQFQNMLTKIFWPISSFLNITPIAKCCILLTRFLRV